jgi:acetolactate synthase-1/2/3 large subunit
MGYGLATAIGAAFANRTRRVILTEGEGGFCQNLQELALLKRFSLPIKIFLIENKGYASIRSTQKKFFKGEYLGCDYATGLDFPDWIKLFDSYGIPCRFLHEDDAQESVLRTMLDEKAGPEAWIVPVDPDQPNWPALLTTLAADGFLQSSPLYDMLPKLSDEMMSYVGRYLPVADKVST